MSAGSDPFDRNYQNQPVNDLIVTMGHCGAKQKDHPAFKENVPEYVTLPPELLDLAEKMGSARDGNNMADELKALVGRSVLALNNNADHVVKFARHRNDPGLLLNAGYDLRPEGPIVKNRINLLDLVPGLSAKHIPGVPGGILAILKLAKGKAITELQITETPDVEESWQHVDEGIYNKARIEIRGLEPTKRKYLRARYHEGGSVGRWTEPICIIVL